MTKIMFYLGSLLACTLLAFNTGCASGGYKITRTYAQWVNSKTLILRIIIYIFTSFVFAITLLVDSVIFNTVDFWEGKVSQGDFEFNEGGKIYQVKHEILPGSGLKRSTIQINEAVGKIQQVIVLNETTTGEIEMSVDGVVRSRVRNITSVPMVSIFDQAGKLVEDNPLFLTDLNFNQNIAKF